MADAPLAGLGILIVEDEPLLRKQLAAQMERLGADATGAADLRAARQLIADLSFDFALVDVNLPDGRGTDLLQEKIFPPNTGIIVMTANGAISGAVEAMRLGALDYLVKPFDALELPLVIARARRTKQTSRAAEHRRESDSAFFCSALAGLFKGVVIHHKILCKLFPDAAIVLCEHRLPGRSQLQRAKTRRRLCASLE